MDARAPAARDAKQIADDRARLAGKADAIGGEWGDRHLAQLMRARGGDHRVAAQYLDAAAPAFSGSRNEAVARVDDGGQGDAGIAKRRRQLVGAVVVGEDDRAAAWPYAIAPDVALRSTGQHDPGQVVVDEDERALD